MNRVVFSHVNQNWRTPLALYEELDREFCFTIDVAASAEDHLAARYYTEQDNALTQPWTGNVFVNPPYGRGVGEWLCKAQAEVQAGRAQVVVMLLPARTDTQWFHDYAMKATEIRFLRGRLKFGEAKQGAPFPSMLVIWR